jgi:hypothetical protein
VSGHRHRAGAETPRRRRRIGRTLAPLILPCSVSCGDAGPTGSTPTEGRPVEGGQEVAFERATIRLPDRMIAIDFANHTDASLDEREPRVGGEEGGRLATLVRDPVAHDSVTFAAFDPSTPGDRLAGNVNVVSLTPGPDRRACPRRPSAGSGPAWVGWEAKGSFSSRFATDRSMP